MKRFLRLVSIKSCDRQRQNDCSLVVLQQLFGQVGLFIESKEMIQFIENHMREFGLPYKEDSQITEDLFEAIIMHFCPDWQFELYQYITMPWEVSKGVPKVNVKILNAKAKNKSEYRLCLKTSWDYGAGHYVLIDTNYATQDEIKDALIRRDFEEQLIGTQMYQCGNMCGTAYCSVACQAQDWQEHRLTCGQK